MVFQNYVTSVSVCGEPTLNARYSLTITFGGSYRRKVAIVILLNPSSSAKCLLFYPNCIRNIGDIKDVDTTTQIVIEKIWNEAANYKKVILLNLFPYFDSKPDSIDSIFPFNTLQFNHSYVMNLKIIQFILRCNKNSDVYIAWGKQVNINAQLFRIAKQDITDILINEGKTNVIIKPGKKSQFQNVQINVASVISNAVHGRFW